MHIFLKVPWASPRKRRVSWQATAPHGAVDKTTTHGHQDHLKVKPSRKMQRADVSVSGSLVSASGEQQAYDMAVIVAPTTPGSQPVYTVPVKSFCGQCGADNTMFNFCNSCGAPRGGIVNSQVRSNTCH
jgi:hypothetical protein